jgi:iron complex outermembrane recepter protein
MRLLYIIFIAFFTIPILNAQTTVKGKILDESNAEPLIGASVSVKGSQDGALTDFDGYFSFSSSNTPPLTLVVSYVGYEDKEVVWNGPTANFTIKMGENSNVLQEVEIKSSRISDKQKESPLTVESMDLLAIKETPAVTFYDGLGNMKGVDLTAASLGFKVINMRGFNSTNPVRSLQIIDGIDNQAPGLNFSLGNFLGASDLDVLKVDLVQGASSAFYGPNAFNGVISMETKNPFYHRGLSVSVKGAERNLFEVAGRYAAVLKNKAGFDFIGFKMNAFFLRANDWQALDYSPVEGSRTNTLNPGRFDAVNIYGDEYNQSGDNTSTSIYFPDKVGLGIYHRNGYREVDLVDYNTRNYKISTAVHFRTSPSKKDLSPEAIYSYNFGSGTTVFQGDNRFSLRNILFGQHRVEWRLRDKWFIRAYTTRDDGGDSYDPYATALRLQREFKTSNKWYSDYNDNWRRFIDPQILASGFPSPIFNPGPPISFTIDTARARTWYANNQNNIVNWHQEILNKTNENYFLQGEEKRFLNPGTPEFKEAFDRITSNPSNRWRTPGTRFIDESSLYHAHGEYKLTPGFVEEWIVGGNYRLFAPFSAGTIFRDSARTVTANGDGTFNYSNFDRIYNSEFGVYTGIKKKLGSSNKWTANATVRLDKNQNFQFLISPAASIIYTPSKNNYFRFSFSSALRNPTLADQYLNLNVGPAILSGNIVQRDSLYTLGSVLGYFNNLNPRELRKTYINTVRPERVNTVEVGARSTIFEKLYIDAGAYYSLYNNFIGYNLAVDGFVDQGFLRNVQVYRLATNSQKDVYTTGANLGLSYFVSDQISFNGNYSWNKLVVTDENDPIIPAFNTPEHKFNVGMSGRKVGPSWAKNFGYNINYKWVKGFIFEGSPQFTGTVPGFDLVDVQVNYNFEKLHTTLKIGASNLLNNLHIEVYGGPLLGRLAYAQLTYEFSKK